MSQLPEHLDDVGPGWGRLLLDIHEKVVELAPEYRVGQVKEKFGTLRVYLDNVEHEVCSLVYEMEQASHVICERCGESGKLRQDRYWLLTLCDECSDKRLQVE